MLAAMKNAAAAAVKKANRAALQIYHTVSPIDTDATLSRGDSSASEHPLFLQLTSDWDIRRQQALETLSTLLAEPTNAAYVLTTSEASVLARCLDSTEIDIRMGVLDMLYTLMHNHTENRRIFSRTGGIALLLNKIAEDGLTSLERHFTSDSAATPHHTLLEFLEMYIPIDLTQEEGILRAHSIQHLASIIPYLLNDARQDVCLASLNLIKARQHYFNTTSTGILTGINFLLDNNDLAVKIASIETFTEIAGNAWQEEDLEEQGFRLLTAALSDSAQSVRVSATTAIGQMGHTDPRFMAMITAECIDIFLGRLDRRQHDAIKSASLRALCLLSENSQMIQTAIQHYDHLFVQLIALLGSNEKQIQIDTLHTMAYYTMNHIANQNALLADGCIRSLHFLMRPEEDGEIRRAAAKAITSLVTGNSDAQDTLIEAGVLEHILSAYADAQEILTHDAELTFLTCWDLSPRDPQNVQENRRISSLQRIIGDSHAIDLLIQVLSDPQARPPADYTYGENHDLIAVTILNQLTTENIGNAEHVHTASGIQTLLHIIRRTTPSTYQIVEAIAHLLINLIDYNHENCEAIVDNDGLSILIGLFGRYEDTSIHALFAKILGTVCNSPLTQRAKDTFRNLGGLNHLIEMLADDDPHLVEASLGALVNFSANNQRNCVALSTQPILTSIIGLFGDESDVIKKYTACLLSNILELNNAIRVRDTVRNLNGIHWLVVNLNSTDDVTIMTSAKALIQMLTDNPINQQLAHEQGAVQSFGDLTTHPRAGVQAYARQGLHCFPDIDDIAAIAPDDVPPPSHGRALTIIPHNELTYTQQLPVGGGTAGNIYRGQFGGLPVAIKVFHPDDTNPNAAAEHRREASFLSVLAHPGIMQFFGIDSDNHALVLEFMEQSLFTLLHRSDVPLDLTWRLTAGHQITSALAYLHTHSIIHGDVKSLNIMVAPIGHMVLTDFGDATYKTAEFMENNARRGKGTVPWAAPERIRDDGIYNESCDAFSVAMTLFELLYRRVPKRQTANGFVRIAATWILAGNRPATPDIGLGAPAAVSEQCTRLIHRLWSTRAADRPPMPEVCDTLETCIQQLEL